MHALGVALGALAALRMPGPLSPRNANYTLSATLDDGAHTVTGRARLTWRNDAREPARELVFHLYMNAFKNELSTFMRESRGRLRMSEHEREHGWGAIDVKRWTVRGADVTARVRVDDTLATVPLDAPVEPGATIVVETEFTTTLPKVFARTGWHKDFFAVAQWFPKIGVWDCDMSVCRWRAHQHHAASEFFADFGVYDATVDVPERYQVGATGVPTDEKTANGRRVTTWHAEDVHDFVFAACPRFAPRHDTFHDDHGDVDILLLGIRGHEVNAPRHLAAARATLAELARRFGPYPYSRLTIVDVPQGAEGAGGMEYPTLFFTFDAPVPRGVHLPELVTAHELSHQYFQGMVASDEVEEAWLDEGFTETMTDWALERMFGRGGSYDWLGHFLPTSEESRLGYRRQTGRDALETRAFEFVDLPTYGAVTYGKTDVLLRTVENYLGTEKFERGMRRYFETWRFKHPRMDDFTRAFDAGTGVDLSWLWRPALETSEVLDYELMALDVRHHPRPSGLFEADGGARREVDVPADEKAPWTSEVVVRRRGEMTFPVELEVAFDDGTTRRERWDGADARWKRFTFEGEHKVVRAQLDPEHKVPLDVTRWNDGRRAEGAEDAAPRRRVTGSFFAWLSALLGAVGF
jgi:Peptidase family M1 domain